MRRISRVYGTGHASIHALKEIEMTISEGEFIAVMGASGSGKSTFLNILGCLDTPTSGFYLFRGISVEKLSRNQRALLRRHYLGFVFQGYNLLNRTTALENVELPLIYRGVPATRRRALALEALDSLGLAGWEKHTPGELSGGQLQRVALARAIVTEPEVLLADEPTGNLDSERSHEIMNLISRLNREIGITVVMVTHEKEMAAYAERRVVFVDGLISARGTGGSET
jgi:putative ABC transport system ATP-binding protein